MTFTTFALPNKQINLHEISVTIRFAKNNIWKALRRDFSTKENSGEKNSEKKKKGKKYSKQRQYTRPRLFMSKNLKHLYEEQSKNHSNTAQTQGSARGEYCGRRKRNNIQAFAKIAGVVTRGTAAVPVLAGPGIAVV